MSPFSIIRMLKAALKTSLVLLGCSTLVACSSTLLTGANVYYERHSLQKQLVAFQLDHQIEQQIKADPHFAGDHIRVVIFEETVLLVGQTRKATNKRFAEEIAIMQAPDYRILNFIYIGEPIGLITATKDSWISTKLNAKIIATNQLQASHLQIVTENKTVYLMGVVRPDQAEILQYLAQQTKGVKRIVALLEYIKPQTIQQTFVREQRV